MDKKTDYCNIPKSIEDKMNLNYHNDDKHPIGIIKNHIYKYFKSLDPNMKTFDDLSPFVSVEDNFDKLLIPKNHPARSKSDTYYLNEHTVLRTQTSAHQNELLAQGHKSFLVTGDVFRKDEIDARHYPVFHQMEGVIVKDKGKGKDDTKLPLDELKELLGGLIEYLFPKCEYRFNSDYFPFTDPSIEVEVMYQGKWLEVLGAGIMQEQILKNNGLDDHYGLAWGLGVTRLAMILFNITDIRYLFSTHPKFLSQFSDGIIKEFQPFSTLESQTKDVSFFIPPNKIIADDKNDQLKWLDENDFFECIRDITGDMMKEVSLSDTFYNKKIDKYSRTYRMIFSSNDPDMKDPGEFFDIVIGLNTSIRSKIANFDIVLR